MAADISRPNNWYEEYKYFLINYVLPIIGISYNNNIERVRETNGSGPLAREPYIRQEPGRLVFSNYDTDFFEMEWYPELSRETLNLARRIIADFTNISKFKLTGKGNRSLNIKYATDQIREENYRLAVQKGVCDWCVGGQNDAFYRLLQILEEWSVKTYEGKKVTLGFVFNPQAKSLFPKDEYGTWLDFLKDDYAATLTDCIHSVIQLDSACDFAGYLSVTDQNTVDAYSLNPRLPYRFARVIDKYVGGSCVGVFLLSSGDIILSKDHSICMVKRNLRWLNISFSTFHNMIAARVDQVKIPDELLEQVYASTLDVSFAHTGGIIAVIHDVHDLLPDGKPPILNPCDNLLDTRSLGALKTLMGTEQQYKNLKPREIQKRLLKRKAILSMVGDKDFSALDRKLRAELIAMDGACILDKDGTVCAIGAIIQNDSGSAGGGRSAAAKKLSTYGMAVKISTDGYIEVFANYEAFYSVI